MNYRLAENSITYDLLSSTICEDSIVIQTHCTGWVKRRYMMHLISGLTLGIKRVSTMVCLRMGMKKNSTLSAYNELSPKRLLDTT